MMNFYRKFLQGGAWILFCFTDPLKGPGKALSWSPVLDFAYTRAKDLLSFVSELVHPCPDAPISLAVDASNNHLGAVLQQLLDGSWALLAFYFKKLSEAEKKYSAFDCELLAAYSSLRHFAISGLCLKVETLLFLPNTSLSPMLCLEFLRLGPPVNRTTSPTWLSQSLRCNPFLLSSTSLFSITSC